MASVLRAVRGRETQLLTEAHRERNRGHDRAAIRLYRRILVENPRNIEVALRVAPMLAWAGEGFEAWQLYRRVALEYARSHVERAAYSVATDACTRATDVSMAKISAGEAALEAARISLQVHGALGYTWEQDLHVWMRRAWTLDLAWGETTWHRARLADALFDGASPTESFGFSPQPG